MLLVNAVTGSDREAGDLQFRWRLPFGDMQWPRVAGRDEPELAGVEREHTVQEREGVAGGDIRREFPGEPGENLGRRNDHRIGPRRNPGEEWAKRDAQ